MRWALTIFFVAVGLTVLGSIFIGSRGGKEGAVNVVGSTSIQPFAEMLAQEFHKRRPQYYVEVQGGGSTAGIEAVRNGIADIGTCSRELKPDEQFESRVIAKDGLAIIVHWSNPVSDLTSRQIRDMFTGRITNWKDVGGKDQPIRLISREEGSGTREAFQKLVLEKKPARPATGSTGTQPASGASGAHVPSDVRRPEDPKPRISRKALTQESNGAVRELVKNDACAIGYMSLGLVSGEAKILKVDGVMPQTSSVTDGTYPLVRPFLFVLKKGELGEGTQRFIDFVLSEDGQAMLEKEGLVRAGKPEGRDGGK